MWKPIKTTLLPLLCLANLIACVIPLKMTWNTPLQPAAVIPVKLAANWGRHPAPRFISRDGRWLYVKESAEGKNELIEWPTARRIVLATDFRERCGFSPDGKHFVAFQDDHLCFWDLTTGAEERTFCHDFPKRESVHFSPAGKQIAVVSDSSAGYLPFLQIWDVNTKRVQGSVWTSELFGHRASVSIGRVAWGCEQTFFVEKTNINHAKNTMHAETVCCWDVDKYRARFEIDNLVVDDAWGPTWGVTPDGKCCVAIVTEKPNQRKVQPNPFIDGKELSVPSRPMVQAWDVPTGKLLWQRPFPSERAWFHLSFRPDSRQVAISSRDVSRNYRAELQLWNLEDGASRSLVQAESKGPFGQFVLTATGRYLQYHDPPWVGNTPWPSSEDTPSIVGGWWRIHENEARPAITFDDDGHWYDGERTKHAIFSPSEKNQERRIGQRHANMNRVGHTEGIEVPGVQANLSPDERWLAMRLTFVVPKDVDTGRSIRPADSWHYELHLIDLHDGSRSPIIHDAERWTFSPDGKTLITAGDGNLRVWLLPLENITSQRWVFGLLAIVLCCLQIRLVTPWLRESP